MAWDLFISHASEDKDDVARPLADKFIELGLSVWYDEYTLTVGDSLRRSIDRGLAGCRFGLVILSPHFFQKEWTQKELDGLVAREDGSEKRILPVWHNVKRSDVVAFSPPLADKLGVSTAKGLNHVVREIMRVFQINNKEAQIAGARKKLRNQKRQRTATLEGKVSQASVDESGQWVLLNTRFYQARAVRQNKDQTFSVEIHSRSAEVDAAMNALRPHHFGKGTPIPFAYANDAWVVTVKDVEMVSEGKGRLWTISLVLQDVEYGGSVMEMALNMGGRHYSSDDIARLRAGRILLNDPPPLGDKAPPGGDQALLEGALLESHIQGMNTPTSAKDCIIRAVYREYKDHPRLFLQVARLAAIYFLKASGVVEQVRQLTLGPLSKGKVHVVFHGVRRKKYSNVEPVVIDLEGDCPLD